MTSYPVATRRELAATAASRYRAWCKRYGNAAHRGDAVLARLDALGPSPEPEAVEAIMEGYGWTWLECTSCGEQVNAAAVLDNHDGGADHICEACLVAMLAAVRGAK